MHEFKQIVTGNSFGVPDAVTKAQTEIFKYPHWQRLQSTDLHTKSEISNDNLFKEKLTFISEIFHSCTTLA